MRRNIVWTAALLAAQATMAGGCALNSGKAGTTITGDGEQPLDVEARELYRRARAEIERSRSEPVALDSAAALALASIELKPDYAEAYMALAEARSLAGNHEGAVQAVQKAFDVSGGDLDLKADLEVARKGLLPGKTVTPPDPPPGWLSFLKVGINLIDRKHAYDEPIRAEVFLENLSSQKMVFDPMEGVDPVVDLLVLVSRKSDRYDEYGAAQVSFRHVTSLEPGQRVSKHVDLNQGTVAVALAAFAPHYSRVLAFKPVLMGKRGQPWAVEGKTVVVTYEGVPERESVFSDIEDQLFSAPAAERVHLIKLYGHLVAHESLPAAFAPRCKVLDFDLERANKHLLRLLDDKDPFVRAAAARAVTFLKDHAGRNVIDKLKEFLGSRQDWIVRAEAVYSLAHLLGQDASSLLAETEKSDPMEAVRRLAAAAALQIEQKAGGRGE